MDRELLDLLACPECRSANLTLDSTHVIICAACDARYPVVNGVPNMLPSQLYDTLAQKEEYTDKLMRAGQHGEDLQNADDPDTDRFMWEHHLYDWGKQVVFSHKGAAEVFNAYAEDGARNLCSHIDRWTGGVAGKRLLYVGSGNDFLVALPLQEAGAFLVNVDVVGDSMRDLAACGARNCVCGDARRLPFRDAAFDVAFCKGSLHHSQPIGTPLHEMARVTTSGGHILAAEPNRYFGLPRLPLPAGLGRSTPYERAISRHQVMRALAAYGVNEFHTTAFTYAHPGTPAWLARTWELLGRALPPLFGRLAFEFILHGRKA